MDEVRATLQSWNLSQYADVFFEEGYDDLAYLMTLSEEALQRVAESTGMKPGEHTLCARVRAMGRVRARLRVQLTVEL